MHDGLAKDHARAASIVQGDGGTCLQKSANAAALIGGKPIAGIRNVSQPTMTIYGPQGQNTGTAVVVFPGGGFEMLVMDLEGTEVCDWLTSKGITCVLLKYRVPSEPYDWRCDCRPHNFQLSLQALQDAQRALRLVRSHAAAWHVDSRKVGVLGFSAGGYLVAEASTNFNRRLYAPVDAADGESDRPDLPPMRRIRAASCAQGVAVR